MPGGPRLRAPVPPELHAHGAGGPGSRRAAGWSRGRGRAVALAAGFVVDASGPGGFLARALPIPSALDRVRTDARLLGGHFTGARPFAEVAREEGAELSPGPYPDDLAAVHHVLEDGWMDVLPFDHGVTSAGFMLRNRPPAAGRTPAGEPFVPPVGKVLPLIETGSLLFARHPSLAAQLAAAEPVRPLVSAPRAQHRLASAAGPGWALLPHAFAFVDPLFSTGIAWSPAPTAAARRRFGEWLLRALAPRNVAGVGDPARRHLYPVDLALLRERAPLLGLTAEKLAARLPRLRSPS